MSFIFGQKSWSPATICKKCFSKHFLQKVNSSKKWNSNSSIYTFLTSKIWKVDTWIFLDASGSFWNYPCWDGKIYMSRSVAPRDLRSQITLDSVGFRGPGSVQDITMQPAPSFSLGAYTSLDHGSIFWEGWWWKCYLWYNDSIKEVCI